jgi:hypothetical protein
LLHGGHISFGCRNSALRVGGLAFVVWYQEESMKVAVGEERGTSDLSSVPNELGLG